MFVTAELAPLAQSGGLGDAAAGLARALGAQGHEVTCVVPGYHSALSKSACPTLVDGGRVQIAYPNVTANGRFLVGKLFENVEVCFLDLPELFGRDGLYGDRHGEYGDNGFRFLSFCRAAAYRAETELPDVVVAHDWHAGLVPVLMRTSLDRGALRGVGAVQVVHNNAYQGRIPAQQMPYTHLAPDLFHADGLEAWGTLCMLKGGLMWADRIVAVSPTYAREVQTSSFGEGLEGAYRSRSHRLSGIVNGIDAARFDPSTDQALPASFSARDPSGKALCRRALLDRLGLDVPPPGLLVAAIGRLAPQKGWDVLAAAIDGLLELGATLVLLGDGDPWIAGLLESKQRQHSRRIFLRLGFDEALSRQIYAGADVMLVPSRFEPCGLVQLIAQRYGTIPVAHAVGGLVDTIHDASARPVQGSDHADPWARATGVLFGPLSPEQLVGGVARVKALGHSGRLPEVQKRLMQLDVSWDGPAQSWAAVLQDVAAEAKKRL